MSTAACVAMYSLYSRMIRPFSSLLLLLLISSTLIVTRSQEVGAACGPVHDQTGRWISVPATSLSATAPGGPVTAAASGCVTSDDGAAASVQIRMPSGSWTIYNISAKVKSAAATSAAATVSILVGDADAPKAIKKLRERAKASTIVGRVFDDYSTCTRRKISSADSSSTRKMIFVCDMEKGHMTGQFVSLVAPRLTVCEVKLCAKQMQFTPSGLPLTKAAAYMLTDAVEDTPASAADQQNGDMEVAPASIVKPSRILESCDGYTSYEWGYCATGNKCDKTYYPGADVCDCFKCTAFTDERQCEQGDTKIGRTSCCFTCPKQPICAVCVQPCISKPLRVEVTTGVLPTTPDSYNVVNYQYSSTTSANNCGGNPQTATATFTFQQALTATMTFAKEFSLSEKAVAEIGIPFLNKAVLEFSATQKWTTTNTNTETRTSTVTYTLQQQIPAYTSQIITANASAGMITVRVPVTVKTYYTCDQVTTEDNTIIIQTQGVLNAVDSNLQITFGPQVPLNPPIVLPQATRTCASNPQCAQFGLEGNCCPADDGTYNPCCSFCVARPACMPYAQNTTTMCCPARTNIKQPCCDKN